jgi:translation initiation factor IF-1
VGFEHTIPVFERAATVCGKHKTYIRIYANDRMKGDLVPQKFQQEDCSHPDIFCLNFLL